MPAPPRCPWRSTPSGSTGRAFATCRGPREVKDGLNHLVLEPETVEIVGPAINAARSMFLYGEAGNGKSTIAEAIVNIFKDEVFVPFAVHADGQVIQVYDPVIHQPVDGESPGCRCRRGQTTP
jgi:hypothetical protein